MSPHSKKLRVGFLISVVLPKPNTTKAMTCAISLDMNCAVIEAKENHTSRAIECSVKSHVVGMQIIRAVSLAGVPCYRHCICWPAKKHTKFI